MEAPRDPVVRRADTLALLSTPAIDVWAATGCEDGTAHLVPLSLAWVDERAVVAVDAASVTARNVVRTGRARLAVGPTRDVVMIEAVLESSVGVDESAALGESYVAQADWDPRGADGYVFLVLRPERLQAWREVNEMAGRTLMRGGTWLATTEGEARG